MKVTPVELQHQPATAPPGFPSRQMDILIDMEGFVIEENGDSVTVLWSKDSGAKLVYWDRLTEVHGEEQFTFGEKWLTSGVGEPEPGGISDTSNIGGTFVLSNTEDSDVLFMPNIVL